MLRILITGLLVQTRLRSFVGDAVKALMQRIPFVRGMSWPGPQPLAMIRRAQPTWEPCRDPRPHRFARQ
jgi:hypothetical protein